MYYKLCTVCYIPSLINGILHTIYDIRGGGTARTSHHALASHSHSTLNVCQRNKIHMPCTVYYIIDTLYFILYTICYMLHTICDIRYTLNYILYTIHFMLHTIFHILYTIYCTISGGVGPRGRRTTPSRPTRTPP